MSHAGFFRLLRIYSDLWARRNCRVILSGEEHLESAQDRNRVYVVSHPTTWDLPMLGAPVAAPRLRGGGRGGLRQPAR